MVDRLEATRGALLEVAEPPADRHRPVRSRLPASGELRLLPRRYGPDHSDIGGVLTPAGRPDADGRARQRSQSLQ